MWDLVPPPGIEHRHPALGEWSLAKEGTRKSLELFLMTMVWGLKLSLSYNYYTFQKGMEKFHIDYEFKPQISHCFLSIGINR